VADLVLVSAVNRVRRLLRHPSAILVLIAAEAGLAYLTDLAREPFVKALATAAFVAIAAGMILLLRVFSRRLPRPGRRYERR
jgi:2-methylcitrate dehydratase PrpD